jgi:signal peptidase I
MDESTGNDHSELPQPDTGMPLETATAIPPEAAVPLEQAMLFDDLVPPPPDHIIVSTEPLSSETVAALELQPPAHVPLDHGSPAEEEARRRRRWRHFGQEALEGARTLVSAGVYATLIVTFGFQVARVDGLSMEPTLGDHDRLIVNKLAYEIGDPLPGDIVMLYYPRDPAKMFVKRVIAKEGDTVRIVNGDVFVNGTRLPDDYVPPEYRSHEDWGPSVIEQGYYFVMGDHRNNSSDSRHWGPVPKKYIVGKVGVRWWPIQDARIF